METKKINAKDIIICVIGMFFYASGVAITKNCDLGISPIVSTAYALFKITGITLGWCTSIINVVFFIIQRALLKKEYSAKTCIAQLIMSMLFSVFIDGCGVVWAFVKPQMYVFRMIIFLIGNVVLALGMCLIVYVNFVVLPAEGVVLAVTKHFNLEFPKVKMGFDISMVATTCLLSLIFLHQITGVREGTVISMFFIGACAKMIRPMLAKILPAKA